MNKYEKELLEEIFLFMKDFYAFKNDLEKKFDILEDKLSDLNGLIKVLYPETDSSIGTDFS